MGKVIDTVLNRRSPEEVALDKQLAAQDDANLMNLSRPNDWASVGNSEQVSVFLVSNSRRFFKYVPKSVVGDNGVPVTVYVMNEEDAKLGFIEPISDDDPLSFSDEDLRLLINDIDEALSTVYAYIKVYPEDSCEVRGMVVDFNRLAMLRQSLAGNTRLTGKPPKLAKSQFVSGEARVQRVRDEQSNRFGGW